MKNIFFCLLLVAINMNDEKVGTILFLGDSLSAGYGLDVAQSFPSLLQEKIDSEKLQYKIINAGLSGETTAGGLRRIDWLLKKEIDVVVIELGGNDGLRAILPSETEKNLQAIIDKLREKNPKVKILLAGMQAPPNLGKEYTEKFSSIYFSVSKKNKIPLIPFLLESVAGVPKLNLADGIHPTAEGHKLVAETVWKYLKPLLK